MMGKVLATFQDPARAEEAVHALEEAGFTDREISLVSKDHRRQTKGDSLADGTAWGAGIGAGAGLLASAGLLAIPGIGPILAAGPLAAALTGATVGGLTGAFMDWGVPEAEGRHLQREVEEGRAVVLVDAGPRAERAESILRRYGQEVQALHG
ncbi:MAG: DUF1269 domain-containing protein [Firmicutes bacterium]|nr:DUF1269 domain-containing protein [Alicyclobacillaceae bacterium]MCL6496511.1 DUF1269 domain-containing protein [Bacillota bacterium]